MFRPSSLLMAGVLGLALPAESAHPGRTVVDFSIAYDVGLGNEVFVQGAHRDFRSGGILSRGVKLRWSSGNVWEAL